MKFIVGMILLCGMTVILAGFTGDSAKNKSSEFVKENSGDSLKLLYSLGEMQVDSPLHVTVKLQGERRDFSSDKIEATVEALKAEIGLKDMFMDTENGEQSYRVREVISGMDVRMDWVQAGGHSYVKFQLDTVGTANFQHLIDIQKKVEGILEEVGIIAAWNASVQGSVNNSLSAEKTMQLVEGKMESNLSLNEVDSYQDSTTESRSYKVPSLGTFVMSGDQQIHMQVAVHEDSMKKNNRITIGFPVITIEY
ncbi:YwmB family TATA-box binding protein [Paenibacillus sp. EC2-1]|uniref:YwmB family TATA-box binding protein n=1 Tax=Paenibacillus sp. EC2-1 TaxID=3388665 RepID=UPI003BEEBAB1